MRCTNPNLAALIMTTLCVGAFIGNKWLPNNDDHVGRTDLYHPAGVLGSKKGGKVGLMTLSDSHGDASPAAVAVVVPKQTTTPEAFSGNAQCGKFDVVIGVLSSETDKGKMLRQVLRDTWFKLADTGFNDHHRSSGVTIRFLLSLPPGETISVEIASELKQFNDILLLPISPGTRKGYSGGNKPSNILERVRSFMRWSSERCQFRYVLKTDDDCYVAVDKLLERVRANEFETERLYFGRFLFGMSGRDGQGKPDPDNYQNHHEFPGYAGAGYMLTPDVVSFLGSPGLPMLFHRVEDRGVGVMLNGFNVTYRKGEKEFQPWGKCFDESLWIHHFQKDPELMKRRYQRAAAGKSICGEGFGENEVCAMAEQGKPLKLKCKDKNTVIKEVTFASYGKHLTSAPGPCAEGPSALVTDPTCHYEKSKEIVEKACLGERECNSIINSVKDLGNIDPCPGVHWEKRIVATVRCG